jgi:hypothetical protein
MVADVIAEALSDSNQFTQVARELGDLRPDFILSGDLHAIEVYQTGDLWFAHLAVVMRLSRFKTGENLLTYKFDERKPVPTGTFSQAARAISELLSTALDDLIHQLHAIDVPRQAQILSPVPAPAPPLPVGESFGVGVGTGAAVGPPPGETWSEPVEPDAPNEEEPPPGETIFVPVPTPEPDPL